MVRHLTTNTIKRIEDQNSLDKVYSEFLKHIFDECDQHLDYHATGKIVRKKCIPYKPYWDKELTDAWKELSEQYKLYKKSKEKKNNDTDPRNNFKCKQRWFDKLLNTNKRRHNKQMLEKIERLNTSNHKDFWEHLNRLDPRKNKQIPNAVKINGVMTMDQEVVMQTWTDEFKGLYNKPDHLTREFDLQFKSEKEKNLKERLNDDHF